MKHRVFVILLTLLALSACQSKSRQLPETVATAPPAKETPAVNGCFFSQSESVYDGSSLVLVCDMETAKQPADFSFGPGHEHFAELADQVDEWGRYLNEADKATAEQKLRENGSVGFIARVSYVNDTIRLTDGTDLGPFNRMEENGKIYYSPQTGLFGATADQDQLALTFTVITQSVHVWLEGNRVQMYYAAPESREATMTIHRSIPEAETLPPGMERTVQVSTVDEFLAAIGPYTHIIIEAPELELNTASDYGGEGGRYYRWERIPDSDGYSLVIHDVERLSVSGVRSDKTSIFTDCGAADVLTFSNCKNPMIQAVTIGHSCDSPTGSALRLLDCYGTFVNVCRFSGSSAVGISAANCSDIVVESAKIHDCRTAGVILDSCQNVEFWLPDIENCPVNIVIRGDCSSIFRDGTDLAPQ